MGSKDWGLGSAQAYPPAAPRSLPNSRATFLLRQWKSVHVQRQRSTNLGRKHSLNVIELLTVKRRSVGNWYAPILGCAI